MTILRDINLRVAQGEKIAILGASGSGKSSILEMMGGLSRPSSGEVFFSGTALSKLSVRDKLLLRRRKIGFVFQNASLIEYLSAVDNVALPLRYSGVRRRERRARAQDWLNAVGLGHLADRPVARLSGGERQRVAIARALVTEPAVILADEPTGSLDQATGDDVFDMLVSLIDGSRTLVVVTHDPRQVHRFDRTVHMSHGSIVDMPSHMGEKSAAPTLGP